jgi:hypothetical protein
MEQETRSSFSGLQVLFIILLLGLGVIRYAVSTSSDSSVAVGEAIGAIIGSLLLAGLFYLIVIAIRGRGRGPNAKTFIFITAWILGVIALLPQLFSDAPPKPVQIVDGRSQAQQTTAPASDQDTKHTVTQAAAHGDWPGDPLTGGKWVYSDTHQSRRLLNLLTEKGPSQYLGTARSISAFRCTSLSFYGGALLCEGLVPNVNPIGMFTFVLTNSDDVVLIDGKGASIYDANQKAGLKFNNSNDLDSYLRFFSAAVFGQNGDFRIVDSSDDIHWSSDAQYSDKDRASKSIHQMALAKRSDDEWAANSTVEYGSNIYSAVFHVSTSSDNFGVVEMTDDFPLVQNLPIQQDAFSGPVRYEIAMFK